MGALAGGTVDIHAVLDDLRYDPIESVTMPLASEHSDGSRITPFPESAPTVTTPWRLASALSQELVTVAAAR